MEYVDNQIRNLIKEIKALSKGLSTSEKISCQVLDGKTVTFGELFYSTQDKFAALAATLAQAKKRDVVSYHSEGGPMLMQGQSDNVVITLLKEEIEDSPVYQSFRVAPGFISSLFANGLVEEQVAPVGPEKCFICSKTVYPTERVSANGKTMHKNCFRCTQCNTVLKLAVIIPSNAS